MKITLVTGEYPPHPGGVSDYTFHLAHALASLGHHVSVLTSACGLDRPLETNGGKAVEVYPTIRGWNLHNLRDIVQRVQELSPDIVNLQYVPHMYGRGGVAPGIAILPLLLRRRANATLVCTVHEMATNWSMRPRRLVQAVAHRIQMGLLLRGNDRFIVTNPRYYQDMCALVQARSSVHQIPVGANILPEPLTEAERTEVRRSLGAEAGPLLGDLSALSVRKQPQDLVAIIAAIKPVARLALLGGLAGDQSRRRYIEDIAKRTGVADRITWTGFLSPQELSRALMALDVYIHAQDVGASTRSTALVAALAHGLAIVSYRGIETSELFVDGENILLVPQGDTAALLNAVGRVLGSPELREHLAQGARQLYLRHFTWDSIARQFCKVAAKHE